MPRPRKRKIMTNVVEVNRQEEPLSSQNNTENVSNTANKNLSKVINDQIQNIMYRAQTDEAFHKKYIKEMQCMYEKMDHEEFMERFLTMIKSAMGADEKNEHATILLQFCAKFSTSFQTDDTHPVLISTFDWLLSTISHNTHIRYRICQFVNFMLNALGNEASLEDGICDNILTYMVERLRDINPNVRLQAIFALQRLQVPNNPDDVVVKTYQFHLSSDPSPRVREAIITTIGRNYNTIPYIIERLWDIDEKVRRHTYLHMSSYPVKSYKVSQRLTFLEQGLNDRSESVRKVVTTVLLPQWFESYGKNFIAFISALKLDESETEIDRFRKITKVALIEMFKKKRTEELISNLPLIHDNEEFQKCVPIEKLSMEVTLYWLTLVEYLQDKDEFDIIVPELSTFCNYILKYCETVKTDLNKWERMEYQYILLTLMEIIYTFDLGDEIGRKNLKSLLEILLKKYDVGEHIIEIIVRCAENLIENQEERLQFFIDIINNLLDIKSPNLDELLSERIIFDEFLEKQDEKNLKLKYSALKVKMMELKEQEITLIEKKEYSEAEKILNELNQVREEYNNFLKFITDQLTAMLSSLSQSASSSAMPFSETIRDALETLKKARKLNNDIITKCLTISFFMVASKKVNSLTPNVHKLYQDFIRRYIESNSITIRDWALKCGTSYSMIYEQISKDVFIELHSQLFKTNAVKIWKTSIDCIFELIDRYGFSNFEIEEKTNKDRKQNRQLYNTLEFLDLEDETSSSGGHGSNVKVMFVLSHFLDTCEDISITSAIVKGFCRLILHDHIKNDDILEKLLIKYFNPTTDSETNQILGVFFENLIKLKKQEYLQSCLLPALTTILSALYDSPLHEIKAEHVIKFIIDSTRQEVCSPGLNIHNKIALSFVQEMQNNIGNKELLRILSKELSTLQISTSDNKQLYDDLKTRCGKILQCDVDPIVARYIQNFKDILDENFKRGVNNPNGRKTIDGSDEENYLEQEGKNVTANKTDETQNNENRVESNDDTVIEQRNNETVETEKELSSLSRNNEVEKDNNDKNNECNSIKTTTEVNISSGINNSNEKTETTTNDKMNEKQNSNKDQIILTSDEKNTKTDLRYSRKSLNIRHRSNSDEDQIRPPKIRIQAKLGSNTKAKSMIEQQKQDLIITNAADERNTSEKRQSTNSGTNNSTQEQNILNQKDKKNSNENVEDKETRENLEKTVKNNVKRNKRKSIGTQMNLRSQRKISTKESTNTESFQTINMINEQHNLSSRSSVISPSPSSKTLRTRIVKVATNSQRKTPKEPRKKMPILTQSVENKIKKSKFPLIKMPTKLKEIKTQQNHKDNYTRNIRISSRRKLNLDNLCNFVNDNLNVVNEKTNKGRISISEGSQNISIKSKSESQKNEKVLHNKKQAKEIESMMKQQEVRLSKKRKVEDDNEKSPSASTRHLRRRK